MSTKPSPTPKVVVSDEKTTDSPDAWPCLVLCDDTKVITLDSGVKYAGYVALVNGSGPIKAEEIVKRVNHHERLVKALSEMVVCYGNSGGCKRNEEGYCTEHASLCPINDVLALLSELEQEAQTQ